MKKRLTALGLLMCLITAFTGCGKSIVSDNSDNKAETSTSTTAVSLSSETAAPKTDEPDYESLYMPIIEAYEKYIESFYVNYNVAKNIDGAEVAYTSLRNLNGYIDEYRKDENQTSWKNTRFSYDIVDIYGDEMPELLIEAFADSEFYANRTCFFSVFTVDGAQVRYVADFTERNLGILGDKYLYCTYQHTGTFGYSFFVLTDSGLEDAGGASFSDNGLEEGQLKFGANGEEVTFEGFIEALEKFGTPDISGPDDLDKLYSLDWFKSEPGKGGFQRKEIIPKGASDSDNNDKTMPLLIGMSYTAAVSQYDWISFETIEESSDLFPDGTIFEQSVDADTAFDPTQTVVSVKVSAGSDFIVFPDFTGELILGDDVEETLGDLGLKVSVAKQFNDEVPKDYFISCDFKAGDKLRKGDFVKIVVSLGSES